VAATYVRGIRCRVLEHSETERLRERRRCAIEHRIRTADVGPGRATAVTASKSFAISTCSRGYAVEKATPIRDQPFAVWVKK